MKMHYASNWLCRVGRCLALASVLLVLTPIAVRADVTYTYKGNPFSNFVGLACPPDCNIQVTLTLPQPLPPNLNCTVSNIGACFIVTKSFSITDGVITQAGSFLPECFFLTDARGTITGWAVVANGINWVIGTTNAPQLGFTTTDTIDSVGTGPTYFAFNTNSPGAWTMTGQGAARLSLLSGDSQTGAALTLLPNSLVVQTTDLGGSPLAGIPISFAITQQPAGAAGATLTLTSAATGPNGTASTQLTLGNLAGQYQVSATCAGGQTCAPASVAFSETANSLCQVSLPPPPPMPLPDTNCPPPSGVATGLWYQLDPTWAGCHYDNANPPRNTIGDQGCNLTALAACMAFVGTSKDPETLNLILDRIPGAYSAPTPNVPSSGGRITDTIAVTGASRGALWFDMSQGKGVPTIIPPGQSSPELDFYLCASSPKPVIVQVTNSSATPPHSHYVVVTGKDAAGNYSIIDPGRQFPNSNLLSAYGTQFQIRGAVKKANGDPSALAFVLVDTATLLVTAPDGSKTGFDPLSGQVLKGLMQSEYFVQDNSIDTDAETVDATSTTYSVEYSFPPDGTYTLQLVGLQSGPYQLTINAFDANGAQENYVAKPGVATKGSSSSFQVQFSSVPGSATTVTRTATFASILADIANSLQLGLIDDAGIANSLSAKINAASDSFAAGDKITASNILNAFKNQLSAQAGKHVNGVAPQVLQEDADSLIEQSSP